MQNKERYENLEKFIPLTVGKFDIPAIKADDVVYSDFIGFNYAKTYKTPKDKAVHFFLDDYQFARLWNKPNDYINILSQFAAFFRPIFRFTRIFLLRCRYTTITASTGWLLIGNISG